MTIRLTNNNNNNNNNSNQNNNSNLDRKTPSSQPYNMLVETTSANDNCNTSILSNITNSAMTTFTSNNTTATLIGKKSTKKKSHTTIWVLTMLAGLMLYSIKNMEALTMNKPILTSSRYSSSSSPSCDSTNTNTTAPKHLYHLSSSSLDSPFDLCQKRLDNITAIFDQKRSMRKRRSRELTRDIRRRKTKNVPLAKNLFDLYEPEATCITDERFGSMANERYDAFGDGPKFLCGVDYIAQNSPNCLVYSVGSFNEISFEKQVKQNMPNCETHTFDPTLKDPFAGDEYAIFHPWGFGIDDSSNKTVPFETFSFDTIAKRFGHEGRTVDVFKIDCEGCEYSVLPPIFDAIANGTLRMHQVQVEMHLGNFGGNRNVAYDRIRAVFESADRANMRIFHKERNHWGCSGFNCLEYAFVHDDFLRTVNGEIMCGHEQR